MNLADDRFGIAAALQVDPLGVFMHVFFQLNVGKSQGVFAPHPLLAHGQSLGHVEQDRHADCRDHDCQHRLKQSKSRPPT